MLFLILLQCSNAASCSLSEKLEEGITSNIYSIIFSSDTAFTCDSLSTSKTHTAIREAAKGQEYTLFPSKELHADFMHSVNDYRGIASPVPQKSP